MAFFSLKKLGIFSKYANSHHQRLELPPIIAIQKLFLVPTFGVRNYWKLCHHLLKYGCADLFFEICWVEKNVI